MGRRQAREIALQALYQLDINPSASEEGEENQEIQAIDSALQESDVRISRLDRDFARALVRGTRSHLSDIDASIQLVSRDWKISRMAMIDRNIIRLAVFEMKFADPILTKNIAINEAVELAKKFGADHSSRFVNGVLDALMK